MQSPSFDELLALLTAAPLSSTDLARLRDWLDSIRDPAECLALIEAAAAGRPCPHCACARLHRSGFASGLQRYRCLGCGRSFNALTGTPLARLRKRECWLPYIKCLLESRTVRDAALVTGVHRTTSFRWRHRFAPGAARHRPAALTGIVEADETYRLESQKGSRTLSRPPRKRGGAARRRGINREHDCLLVARDRIGTTLDFHTGRGPVTAAQLRTCLQPVLPGDGLLISDGAAPYVRFALDAGIMHESINVRAGRRARGAIHIQNVNGWHSRFKNWLVRFKGVASRYLANYSGWQRLLDAHALRTPAQWLCAAVRQVQ
ncbi:IS1595 family transposase [Massilia sp. G4R7]|uniref:IS1595 family transposase n=1 Tax=Massilia phyllostachyos TaxID=2898585 RepID=A0ABS8Q2H4_9BURK|nr:IS1595 family transposase [Massilia phyllostachyos]MCD2515718.1 IS1595 family transposase [Massilia phyllostachyos]